MSQIRGTPRNSVEVHGLNHWKRGGAYILYWLLTREKLLPSKKRKGLKISGYVGIGLRRLLKVILHTNKFFKV